MSAREAFAAHQARVEAELAALQTELDRAEWLCSEAHEAITAPMPLAMAGSVQR